MKIPKHIHNKLIQRAQKTVDIDNLTADIDDWLEKNNIDVDDELKGTSCRIYIEPFNVVTEIEEKIIDK